MDDLKNRRRESKQVDGSYGWKLKKALGRCKEEREDGEGTEIYEQISHPLNGEQVWVQTSMTGSTTLT